MAFAGSESEGVVGNNIVYLTPDGDINTNDWLLSTGTDHYVLLGDSNGMTNIYRTNGLNKISEQTYENFTPQDTPDAITGVYVYLRAGTSGGVKADFVTLTVSLMDDGGTALHSDLVRVPQFPAADFFTPVKFYSSGITRCRRVLQLKA